MNWIGTGAHFRSTETRALGVWVRSNVQYFVESCWLSQHLLEIQLGNVMQGARMVTSCALNAGKFWIGWDLWVIRPAIYRAAP